MKLTTHLQPGSRLRMSGAIPPHPHMPSQCGETALYILPLLSKTFLLKPEKKDKIMLEMQTQMEMGPHVKAHHFYLTANRN
jgi:hypothetical protein